MKNMIIDGYRTLWKYKWAVLWLYLVEAVYGLLIGRELEQRILVALSDSLAGELLIDGYNSDVFADLSRHEGLDLGAVAQYGMYLLPLFILLSVFIQGGVIANISMGQSSFRSMLRNGLRFFFKFLGVSVLALVLFLILNALLWVPFMIYTGDPFETYDTEKSFFLLLLGFILVSILITSLIAAWSIKVKSNICLPSRSPFKDATSAIASRCWTVLLFALMSLVLFVSVVLFYKWIVSILNGAGISTIGTLVVGQMLIGTVCKIRLWYIGGIVNM